MAKKKRASKKSSPTKKTHSPAMIIIYSLYWAVYLTATMALFEHYGIKPPVPLGAIGWTLFVEFPRILVGWFIATLIFRKS
jgi:hypothetical protein